MSRGNSARQESAVPADADRPVNASAAAKDAPLRVLIACDHIDHDGALHGGGRQLIELVRALDGTPVEPTVCVLRAPSRLGRALQDEGLPLRFFGDHRFSPRPFARFRRLIRERRIDVVHLTDFAACTWGRLAARLSGTPALVQIISHHSEYQPRGYPWYVERAYRTLAPLTERVIANSASTRAFGAERMGFDADRIEVLPCALPRHSFAPPDAARVAALRERYGIADDEPVIGAVTRFHAAKGMRYLVQAFALLLAQRPDARLLLVGQGPEEAALRALAAELDVTGRITFAGFQRDVPAHLGLCRVTAVPSLEEGFGVTALESLALGVPVVASRIGGLPDVVDHGRTGLLVPAADPPALARALHDLLADDARRRRMGGLGRRSADRFSLDSHVARLTTIYREMAARRRPLT